MKGQLHSRGLPPFLLFSLLTACGAGDGAPGALEALGSAASEILGSNALNPNALNPNALNPNALAPGALAPNVLLGWSLSGSVLNALRDPGEIGHLSRQLLRYIVGCALDATQSFQLSWDEGGELHEERYRGELGLAPTWIDEPLDEEQQRWVSACVASRANWYGVSVIISSRGAHAALREPDRAELWAYPHQEGAFWGNLFTSSPRLYACYREANIRNSRHHMRDCAAGHRTSDGTTVECPNIHIVGACEDWCDRPQGIGGYHLSCWNDQGEPSTQVVATYLPP